jgi:hypothetical protein
MGTSLKLVRLYAELGKTKFRKKDYTLQSRGSQQIALSNFTHLFPQMSELV